MAIYICKLHIFNFNCIEKGLKMLKYSWLLTRSIIIAMFYTKSIYEFRGVIRVLVGTFSTKSDVQL